MGSLFEITLGIMTAVGGFIDISELVFASQAGSKFHYTLIWAFVLATIGIIVLGEMSGRVAIVEKQPLFNLIRRRLGFSLGFFTLVAAVIANFITCSAEIGGIALILQLLTGGPYKLLIVATAFGLAAIGWLFPFKWIERLFGFLGLFMIVFAVAALLYHPQWGEVARGALPEIPTQLSARERLIFAYYVVAIVSAVMFPYEIYFYSSGGIEEKWTRKDILTNRLTTGVGFLLGAAIAVAVLINASVLFSQNGVSPENIGTVAMQNVGLGKPAVVLGLLGMLFAIAGAGMETALANGYCISQFFGWEWGRYKKPIDAPRFTYVWIFTLLGAMIVMLAGASPLEFVEYAIVLSIVILPLSYLPLLVVANDRRHMKERANGLLSKTLGWFYFAVIVLAGLAAVPLYFITGGGKA